MEGLKLNYPEKWGQTRFSVYRRIYPSKTQAGLVNGSDFTEHRYDLNGNMNWERKRSGASFAYSYDGRGKWGQTRFYDLTPI